jgi:MFS family permease
MVVHSLKNISEHFNVEKQNVGLLLSFFTIPGVIFTPLLGMLADRIGRKKVLLPALLLFTLAGTACGFATSFEMLLGFTFLQGVGAASLGALNVTLIGDFYADDKRTAVMGYNNAVLSIGTASFPLIGGALAAMSWNYPFFMPALGLIVAFFVAFKLDDPHISQKTTFREYIKVIGTNLKNKKLVALYIVSMSTFILLFGAFLSYLPFIVSDKFNGEPFTIGLLLMSMSATSAAMSALLGNLVKKFGQINLLIAAFILYAAALLLMFYVPEFWLLPVATILYGAAQGINLPNVQSIIAGMAPRDNRAAFMSINRMVSQLGQALGPLVMSFVFGFFATEGVFWAASILSILIFFVVLMFIRK